MRHKHVKGMACGGQGPPCRHCCCHLVALLPESCPYSEQERAWGATPFSFSGTEEVGLKLRPKGQGRSAQQGGWRGRPREGEHPANLWAGGGDRLRVGSQGKQGRRKMSPDHRESERASR